MIHNAQVCIFKLQGQRNEPPRTASPIYDSDNENDFSFDLDAEPINSPPPTRRVVDRNEMATPRRRAASASPRNSYCPKPRSGGYAILV